MIRNLDRTVNQQRSKLIVFLSALPLLAVILAFGMDKHLSADGANYFIRILETQSFTIIDWSRQFANYISQSLLVLTINLGVENISILRAVFGASLFVPWLLAFSLSLFALRHEDKSVLLFFLISMVSVNLTSDYILAGEHHVMALLSWPILFLLLRKPELQSSDIILLVALLIIFTRLYPTALIPGALYLLISLVRFFGSNSNKQKGIFLGTSILSIAIIAVASYDILFPRSPGNKLFFSEAASNTLLMPEAMASIFFLVFLMAGWLLKRNALTWLALLPIVGFVFYVIGVGHSLSAGQSFDNRTLSLSILPLLMLATIAVQWKNRSASYGTIIVTTIFVGVFVTANLLSTLRWDQFRSQMRIVLEGERGFVEIETTDLNLSPQSWGWNNDQLSVIWSDGCVKAIVLNAKDVGWAPKGPPENFRLKDYTCYTSELAQFDGELCTCVTKRGGL